MSPLILKSNYKEYSNLGCSSHPFPGLWMYGIIHLLHMASLETSGHLLWVNSRSLYGSFCGAGFTLRTSCKPGKCSTTKLHAQANLTPFFLLFLEFSLSNTFHGFIILWRGCFLLKKIKVKSIESFEPIKSEYPFEKSSKISWNRILRWGLAVELSIQDMI